MKNFILTLILGYIMLSCESPPPAVNTDITTPVTVIDLKPSSIQRFVSTTGTVYPTQEVFLKSELAGAYQLQNKPATGRKLTLGDPVKKGQVIIRLEDKEYENGIQLESKKLSLASSERNFEKQKSLYEKGGVTLNDLKSAEIEYVNSQYAFENATIQLEKMNIRAPFDGVIVEIPYFTPGVKIESGNEVVKIMDYSVLQMDVQLPEKHLLETRPGIESRITNYTIKEDTLMARVTQVSPAITEETRSFQAIMTIDNPDGLLRPGMFVKAELIMEKKDSTIVIPKSLVIQKGKKSVVFIAEKGLAIERTISTGLENPEFLEVLDGLKFNDRLITSGFETLKNRATIDIIR
ncbi:MAG: efflux RND transporter periplasmic adaptor subunit [Cyclobacteriaceae bacterium]